jgi:hypothetical protein
MDMLRSCYRSAFRLYPDHPEIVTWGTWHWCPKGAELLPFPHAFSSFVWDSDEWFEPVIGELVGPLLYSHGQGNPRETGHHFCGSIQLWQQGSPLDLQGSLPLDLDGVPTCCGQAVQLVGGVSFDGSGIPGTGKDYLLRQLQRVDLVTNAPAAAVRQLQRVGVVHAPAAAVRQLQRVGVVHAPAAAVRQLQRVGVVPVVKVPLAQLQAVHLVQAPAAAVRQLQRVGVVPVVKVPLAQLQAVGVVPVVKVLLAQAQRVEVAAVEVVELTQLQRVEVAAVEVVELTQLQRVEVSELHHVPLTQTQRVIA